MNGSHFEIVMGIIFISSIVYSGANVVYDIISRTDIENTLAYRGGDRVIVSITMCVLFAIVTVISAFNELSAMYKDHGIFITLITVLIVSVIFSLFALLTLSLVLWIFSFTKFYPKYEVEINKDEYWRIIKVTKDNRVILKREDVYQILPEVKDLDYKKIRVQQKRESIKEK